MVVMGDWGAIWYGNRKDNYLLKWWSDKPWTTFVVQGNHENYNAIERLPIIYKFGGRVRRAAPTVFLAITGEIYDLNGYECLVVNGAESHDIVDAFGKPYRKEGISWWPQEKITQEDIDNALTKAYYFPDGIDFIFSHTGGSEVNRFLGFYPTESDYELDRVLGLVPFKKHFCGHYHEDMWIGDTRIIYNDIIEIHDELRRDADD